VEENETQTEKIDRILATLDRILPVVEKLLHHPMLKRWLS
jgi:hypothetical protein